MLDALGISPASQTLVFSQTSFQAERINIHNPRAVFFNDTVAVGWVRGGEVLEVAVQDPRQGRMFYALEQKAGAERRSWSGTTSAWPAICPGRRWACPAS